MECVLFVFLIYFFGICAPTNICVSYTYTYMFAFAGRTAGPNWLTFFRETMGTMVSLGEKRYPTKNNFVQNSILFNSNFFSHLFKI